MLYSSVLVTNTLRFLGELEELWLVFLVFLVEVLLVLVRERLRICVGRVVCLLLRRFGEDGIVR